MGGEADRHNCLPIKVTIGKIADKAATHNYQIMCNDHRQDRNTSASVSNAEKRLKSEQLNRSRQNSQEIT